METLEFKGELQVKCFIVAANVFAFAKTQHPTCTPQIFQLQRERERERERERIVSAFSLLRSIIARNPGQNGGLACALHATMAPEQHKKCMGKYIFSIITMS